MSSGLLFNCFYTWLINPFYMKSVKWNYANGSIHLTVLSVVWRWDAGSQTRLYGWCCAATLVGKQPHLYWTSYFHTLPRDYPISMALLANVLLHFYWLVWLTDGSTGHAIGQAHGSPSAESQGKLFKMPWCTKVCMFLIQTGNYTYITTNILFFSHIQTIILIKSKSPNSHKFIDDRPSFRTLSETWAATIILIIDWDFYTLNDLLFALQNTYMCMFLI